MQILDDLADSDTAGVPGGSITGGKDLKLLYNKTSKILQKEQKT